MVWELCPICNDEVELEDKMEIQICPTCNNDILPCALCDMDHAKCNECDLEAERKMPLKEKIKDRYYHDYEFVYELDKINIPRVRKMDILDLIEKYFMS